MKKHTPLALALSALLLAATSVQAQSIERMKMTDGDLSCQQMVDEIKLMDMMAAQANAQPAAQQQQAQPENNVGAQVAGAVAQQAIVHAAARGSFGGFGGFGGSAGSALGGLFGGLAAQAAAPQAPPPQAAPTGNPMLAAQAAGRKEHLTGLFLGKNCRMSEMR